MLQIIKGLNVFKLPILRTQLHYKDTNNKPILFSDDFSDDFFYVNPSKH